MENKSSLEQNPEEPTKLEINDILMVSLIRFLVQKDVISAAEFEEYLRDVELTAFKSASPELIEKFGAKIKGEFDLIYDLLQAPKS